MKKLNHCFLPNDFTFVHPLRRHYWSFYIFTSTVTRAELLNKLRIFIVSHLFTRIDITKMSTDGKKKFLSKAFVKNYIKLCKLKIFFTPPLEIFH